MRFQCERFSSSRMHVGVKWRDGLEDRAINWKPTAHRLRITKDGWIEFAAVFGENSRILSFSF